MPETLSPTCTVVVENITGINLVREALEFSHPGLEKSKMSHGLLYERGHSIMRLITFKIKMTDIPSFVSTHLVRHSAVGQFHYVSSNRNSYSGAKPSEVTRMTPVNHFMVLNAQHLHDMAKSRLCSQSSPLTIQVMRKIVEAVEEVDHALLDWLHPPCYYTGYCREAKPCSQVLNSPRFV